MYSWISCFLLHFLFILILFPQGSNFCKTLIMIMHLSTIKTMFEFHKQRRRSIINSWIQIHPFRDLYNKILQYVTFVRKSHVSVSSELKGVGIKTNLLSPLGHKFQIKSIFMTVSYNFKMEKYWKLWNFISYFQVYNRSQIFSLWRNKIFVLDWNDIQIQK